MATAMAQKNNVETEVSIVVENPGNVTLKESDESLIIANGAGEVIYQEDLRGKNVSKKRFSVGKDLGFDNSGISFSLGDKKKRWSLVIEGLGIGLNSAGNQTQPDFLEWGKSFDITWLYALGVEYRQGISRWTFGIGFDWKNFKSTSHRYRMERSPGTGVQITEYDMELTPKNSTMKIFNLCFPLLYQVRIPYIDTDFTVGPILNVSPYASLKTNFQGYYNNDNREDYNVREYQSHIGQRPVTLDIYGSLTYHGFGVYMRCGTMKALRDKSPFNFTPLTLGVMLLL